MSIGDVIAADPKRRHRLGAGVGDVTATTAGRSPPPPSDPPATRHVRLGGRRQAPVLRTAVGDDRRRGRGGRAARQAGTRSLPAAARRRQPQTASRTRPSAFNAARCHVASVL